MQEFIELLKDPTVRRLLHIATLDGDALSVWRDESTDGFIIILAAPDVPSLRATTDIHGALGWISRRNDAVSRWNVYRYPTTDTSYDDRNDL